MDNLPHLVVEEPKRSKKAIAAIAVFSLMIIMIPLGVYLVSQRTQLLPQAAPPEKLSSENSLTLTSESKQAALGGESAVDILVRADTDNINLVSAKVKFDPLVLKTVRIATDSAVPNPYFATKWLEASFDNNSGVVSLVGGSPAPGIKTEPGQMIKLATIYFKALKLGPATLNIESAQVLRNSDNINVLQKTVNLELNVSEGLAQNFGPQTLLTESSPAPLPKPGPNLSLIAPRGGEAFSYFKPVPILWSSKDIEKIASISLYINEQFFGNLATDLTNTDKFQWQPQSTLLLPYITPSNTYQIEITGVNKRGEQAKVLSRGPFGIIAKNDVSFATPSATLAENLDINTASLMLSQFNKDSDTQSRVDLNQDGQINSVDFWLLRQLLLTKGLIN